jgi:outer membrane protein insertion porin family
MTRLYYYIILFTGVALLISCSATKKVPAGDALYLGATIKLDAPGMRNNAKRNLRADLATLTRPRPNQRILGIPFKLLMNNNRLLRKRFGEPPVLLSQLNLEYNEKILQTSLENRGFFHAKVAGDTVVKRKRARAVYTLQTGQQYFIDTVRFASDTAILQRTIAESSAKSFLKTGDAFDLAVIKGERNRIDAYLKERGYYYFSPDFLIIRVDTTIGKNKVNLYVNIKPGTPQQSTQIYYINDVFIYPNYALRANQSDTLKLTTDYYKGYHVIDRKKLFKPRLFSQAMQFSPGDIYNRKDHNQTISRLVNLNLFKFVKNRFEIAPSADTAKLNVYYYLTPFPKKSLQAELTGSTKSNNLTGSSITVGWRNRNTLRGGELFSIDATVGSEVQFSAQMPGFNTFRAGIETNFIVPRFLVPFKVDTKGGYVPRTTFLLAYEMLNKQKLYTLQSFRAGFGYNWKESLQKEHQFNLVSINYVQPLLITPLYRDSAADNPILKRVVEKQFILGTNYNYNYNQLAGMPAMSSGIYFNGNVDLSGNVAGLITGANAKDNKPKNIFNAQFAQYVRLESDLRYYAKISQKVIWANRLITGVGVPYGNSMQLPYIKQFFVGGTNSLRGFRSRSVGPGSYIDTISRSFLPDQSGDIKIEINSEIRAKLFGIVHGAIFIDVGNIWLFRKDTTRPGAEFKGDFLRELAVDGGVGLRFDVTFLVVRLDVAFPFRRPYPKGQEWILRDIRFADRSWRRQNIVYNLGIGYPF